MSYEIIAIPNFKKQVKKLSKKYPSFKKDFSRLVESLQENPAQGTLIVNNCYKIRMAITSKGKGKSSGSRVITHLKISETKVYLLSIYDKSKKDTISDKELQELLGQITE